jgi:hypothetical protein
VPVVDQPGKFRRAARIWCVPRCVPQHRGRGAEQGCSIPGAPIPRRMAARDPHGCVGQAVPSVPEMLAACLPRCVPRECPLQAGLSTSNRSAVWRSFSHDTRPGYETREPALKDRLELMATLLLALAAVATAWSSYQSNRWTAEYRKASGHTNAVRIEAARAQGLAESQTQIDAATFIQWIDAYSLRRTELVDFYFKRFREEFKPAVVAWIATKPLTNPHAPLTPFVMPQYKLAASKEARQLDAERTPRRRSARSTACAGRTTSWRWCSSPPRSSSPGSARSSASAASRRPSSRAAG